MQSPGRGREAEHGQVKHVAAHLPRVATFTGGVFPNVHLLGGRLTNKRVAQVKPLPHNMPSNGEGWRFRCAVTSLGASRVWVG